MNTDVIKEVDIDLYDRRKIVINAKQYDKYSRFVLFTCYNQGNIFPIDDVGYSAYVRYRKSDDYGVFNSCEIVDGKIKVELTEQMLSVAGSCFADLVIVDNYDLATNDDIPIISSEGELISVNGSAILSSMIFAVNVIQTPYSNTEIESTNEFDALNQMLIKFNDYISVMERVKENVEAIDGKVTEAQNYSIAAKSYAIGGTNSRTGEDADNAKYYYEQARDNANTTTQNLNEVTQLKSDVIQLKEDVLDSQEIVNQSKAFVNELTSVVAKNARDASLSATNAKQSELNALQSELDSNESALAAKSYAVGNASDYLTDSDGNILTDSEGNPLYLSYSRTGEDADNAKYYYEQARDISSSIGGGLIPKGTITFSELDSQQKIAGFMYHITDSFTTDSTFRQGAGIFYPSGTNVYYTADGKWDCLADIEQTLNDLGVYSKTQVDTLLGAKANSNDVYTQSQIDSKLNEINGVVNQKANSNDVYSKTQVDTLLGAIQQQLTTMSKTIESLSNRVDSLEDATRTILLRL